MRLGLTVGAFGPQISVDIEGIREAEKLGYSSVWTAEAWGNDAISPLAFIAGQTERIKLGTAIMQMPARTPAMAAMQVMTVDQLSGGRMICGIGPSGPQVVEGWHGVPFGKPLKRTREYIAILRKIFRREEAVTFDGEFYQMPYKGPDASGLGKPLRPILHPRPDISIVTATISPKGIELAAEIADGFIPTLTTAAGVESFNEFIDKGLAKAGNGKSRDDVAVMPMVNVVLGDDVARCRDMVRPGMALYIGGMGAREKNFYKDHVTRQGWGEVAQEVQDLYLDGKKREAAAAVPDKMIDEFALVGPREKIADAVAEWRESNTAEILVGSDAAGRRLMAELLL